MARPVPKNLIKERSDRIRFLQDYNQDIKDPKQEQRKVEMPEDSTDTDYHHYIESEEIIVEYKKRVEELEDKERKLEKTDLEFAARLEELNTIILRDFTNGSEKQQTEHT
ncbi:hypothetical protein EAF04_008210 [Stromatinia cepivora]|nr:hypothetical protein EAF04_008210 [Stromatinia cepivora]